MELRNLSLALAAAVCLSPAANAAAKLEVFTQYVSQKYNVIGSYPAYGYYNASDPKKTFELHQKNELPVQHDGHTDVQVKHHYRYEAGDYVNRNRANSPCATQDCMFTNDGHSHAASAGYADAVQNKLGSYSWATSNGGPSAGASASSNAEYQNNFTLKAGGSYQNGDEVTLELRYRLDGMTKLTGTEEKTYANANVDSGTMLWRYGGGEGIDVLAEISFDLDVTVTDNYPASNAPYGYVSGQRQMYAYSNTGYNQDDYESLSDDINLGGAYTKTYNIDTGMVIIPFRMTVGETIFIDSHLFTWASTGDSGIGSSNSDHGSAYNHYMNTQSNIIHLSAALQQAGLSLSYGVQDMEAVPEPATYALCGSALLLFGLARRRKA